MKRIAICFILVISISFAACTRYSGLPTDGVWYCESLGMELTFAGYGSSHVIIDGKRIECAFENDRGANDFAVAYLYENCFDSAQIFFTGECNYWNDKEMLVTEWLDSEGNTTGTQYVFVRIQ